MNLSLSVFTTIALYINDDIISRRQHSFHNAQPQRVNLQVLARYIARRGLGSLAGRNVLELGSGTGLVGLVAAHLGARVWITDQACVPVLLASLHQSISATGACTLASDRPTLTAMPILLHAGLCTR